MRKVLRFTALILLIFQVQLRADEGMWLLSLIQQVNYEQMKEMGLELTPEQIYSVNNASLKDAVGALDHGMCTAELVSADGLLLTNHHCGYDDIQNHSSLENDYLKDGFWAMSREEELPNEGKSISFLIRMEEVTDRVMDNVSDDMEPEMRSSTMRDNIDMIRKEAVEGTHYDAQIIDMFEGNRYFLFVMETYMDVRLVGAPPESIGKFGGDTDNWMWPRHTGDFSMFRVYTGPDGEPAEYSPDNIPLQSKHYLPVSLKGYKKGDFAMILGFPGSTKRYITSYELKREIEFDDPSRIKIRGIKQDIMMEEMNSDPEIRIQYSSKYFESSNYWKYFIGQIKGIKDLDVIAQKEAEEESFTNWMDENESRKEMYGNALQQIKEGVEEGKDYQLATEYLFEAVYLGMETIEACLPLSQLDMMLGAEDVNEDMLDYLTSRLKEMATDFYKDYNMETDRKIMAAMLKVFIEDVDPSFYPDFITEIQTKYRGNIDRYLDKYYAKSLIVNEEKYMEFLDDPDLKILEKDPAYIAASSFLSRYREIQGEQMSSNEKIAEGSRLYLKGRIEMHPGKDFYPDANSTMRLTYGTVGDYSPRDAVKYLHFTTLKGVMEKEDPDNFEFIVPEKLKEMYKTHDFGRYGEDGILKLCFTTNNDITGGNSGSPVVNGKGELIGIAFDGNWESMSGDIAFEPKLQKCINVDIRYVLFVIDKFAGAGHLVDEMTISE